MKSDIEAGQGKIIWDGKLLSDETVAGKPLGREPQIAELHTCVRPMLQGRRPVNAWLHGSPGSGKTTVARWVVDETCSSPVRIGVYVNCWQHRTLYSVLQAIIDELRILRAEAQDTELKFDRIRQALRGRPAVVILDEIDRPMPSQREEIIYGLLNLPNTGVVCLANSRQALATLDERVRSRLSPAVIEFPAYSDEQVAEILADRARHALMHGSWSPDIIRHIAAAAEGDARMAIQALRQAAASAEQTGSEGIDSQSVHHFLRQWQTVQQEAKLAGLSEHERIIQRLVAEHAPVSTTRLRELYIAHCRKHDLAPMARRTFSKYLSRLSACGILEVARQPAGSGGRIVRAA